ncbi:hypothetical protein ASPBRDRAFT_31806 [Aspergillus brasiliensis CBS 101740]|uniref:Uncharacterized protein n=1 Tax=Aspergillus brasiliensis (strain CBS 101740 / IMI 381727 / IBT 21946) TaxID=767769 RepID=A0A1L9UE32_ASPBC|nr:hypothetical protein ASPBRDRAFT_31806 [Aspergillus brasiliensis CBS 101740]
MKPHPTGHTYTYRGRGPIYVCNSAGRLLDAGSTNIDREQQVDPSRKKIQAMSPASMTNIAALNTAVLSTRAISAQRRQFCNHAFYPKVCVSKRANHGRAHGSRNGSIYPRKPEISAITRHCSQNLFREFLQWKDKSYEYDNSSDTLVSWSNNAQQQFWLRSSQLVKRSSVVASKRPIATFKSHCNVPKSMVRNIPEEADRPSTYG